MWWHWWPRALNYDQVTKKMTRWRQRQMTTVSDDMANLSDVQCDYFLLHLTTQMTTKIQPRWPWWHWMNTIDNPLSNYLVTTHYDITNNWCDDIDDLGHLTNYDQVMKRTTRWWWRWLTTVSDNMANLSDKRCDYSLLHLTTQMMTKIWPQWSWWHWINTIDNPCDDLVTSNHTHNFLDHNWWLHLAILIAKVKSCMSCRSPWSIRSFFLNFLTYVFFTW